MPIFCADKVLNICVDILFLQIRIILEEQSLPGEAKPFQMARDVYKSCMDVGKIEELGKSNF